MGINSIDATIRLNASQAISELQKFNSASQGLYSSFQSGVPQLRDFSRQAQATTVKLQGLSAGTLALVDAYSELNKVRGMFTSVLGGALEYSKMMETNAIGISGILQSMILLDGKTLDWNKSMAMSKDLMAKLRVEALQTSATSAELIKTFQALLGPGLGAGMSIDEILKFTTVGVNAVKSMGLKDDQLIQELRDLVQGGIRASSSTLAASLGLTDADIKKAKNSSEGLFKFLMKRMEGFERSTSENSKTVAGRLAILQEGLYTTLESAGRDIYKDYSWWLKDIADRMFTVSKETGRISLNPSFVAGVKNIADDFRVIGSVVGKVSNGLADNAGNIVKSLEAFAILKGGQLFLNTGVNALNNAIEKFKVFDAWTKGGGAEARLKVIYEDLALVVGKNQQLVQTNKEMDGLLKGISGGVKNLADHYVSMGVNAEKAAQWQKQIELYIKNGASYNDVQSAKAFFDQQAKAIKATQERELITNKIKGHEENIARIQARRDKSLLTIEKQMADGIDVYMSKLEKIKATIVEIGRKTRENIGKEMDALFTSAHGNATGKLRDIISGGNAYSSGERTINSITHLEERLVALGMEREQAQKRVADVNRIILETDKQDKFELQEIVNREIQNAEEQARNLGIAKERKALIQKELSGLDSVIAKRIEQAKIEKGLKREQNKVADFLAGKSVHTTTNKETGEKTSSPWDDKYIARAKEMQVALMEQNIPLEKRNHFISQYINLLAKGKNVEAEMHAKAVIGATQAYGAKVEEIKTMEIYGKHVEQLRLKVNQYSEARDQASVKEKTLMIDALNNLDALKNTNVKMAERITDVWTKLDNQKQTFFANEENRNKTLIALLKEVAAGNMSVANSMAVGINNAIATNSGRNVDAEVEMALEESRAKLKATVNAEQERENKLMAEYNNVLNKTAEQIIRERNAINELNAGKEVSKTVTNEIIRLSAEEINEQQRAILLYEFKRKAAETGNKSLLASADKTVNVIQREIEAMQKAGREGTVAYKTLIEIIKGVTSGSLVLNDALMKQIELFVKEEQEARKTAGTIKHEYIAAATGLAGAIGSVGMAYQMCTDDTESNIGKLADWAIQGSFVVSAAESMITAIGGLKKAYDALAKSAAIAKLVQMGGAGIAAIGGVAGLVGIAGIATAGALGVYAYENIGKETELAQGFADKIAKSRQRAAEAQSEKEIKKRMEALQDVANKHINESYVYKDDPRETEEAKKIDLRNPKEEEVDKKGQRAAEKAAKELATRQKAAEEAKKSYDSLIESIKIANDGKNLGASEFDKKRDELSKKVLDWNNKFAKLKAKGDEQSLITDKDEDKFKSLVSIYEELERKEIARNERIKEYSNVLQNVDNLEATGAISKREADERRADILRGEIAFYEQLANEEKISLDKRYEYETIIAQKRKALRDAELSDSKLHWDAITEHIRNTSFNLTETFNSGFDTIIGNFTSFGQNIIGSTKSVTEQLRDLCKNLTSDILNMMMKIYMQGLVMNLIGNIFGGGAGVSGAGKSYMANNSSASTFASNNYVLQGGSGVGYNANWKSGLTNNYSTALKWHAASGGLHTGWGLVGERGPELVNFSSPGRVYTADQTRNALSGNGGGVNIKIDLHNESGQQMQAETTGSKFDGESYVVGVVLKAISTNKNGMRNIIRGVATQ